MFIAGFPAGAWAANCYMVAPEEGADCVVIDPGLDALVGIEDIVKDHGVTPVAVLATHGHPDHVWSLAQLCEARNLPAYIHEADAWLLSDPLGGVSGETRAALRHMVPPDAVFSQPAELRGVEHGQRLQLAGIEFEVIGAPGHTRGSVLYRIEGEDDRPPIVFTGDVLFAGSIGRTDLPGGSSDEMMRSLSKHVLTLDDSTVVLSGHGEATEIGRERTSNPFLVGMTPSGCHGRRDSGHA